MRGIDGARIDYSIGAHGACQIQTVYHRIDGPYPPCTRQLQRYDRQQPDRPNAKYCRRLARPYRRQLQRVQHHRQRFDDRCVLETHRGGNGDQVRSRQVRVLAEKTRFLRIAHEAEVGADVVMTREAELAVVAVKRDQPLTPGPVVATTPAGSWPKTIG